MNDQDRWVRALLESSFEYLQSAAENWDLRQRLERGFAEFRLKFGQHTGQAIKQDILLDPKRKANFKQPRVSAFTTF